MLDKHGVRQELGQRPSAGELARAGFDTVVLATGVTPRRPEIPGIEHRSVVSYVDILSGRAQAGRRVVVIGAGGIGFDVAEFLSSPPADVAMDPRHFLAEWGVDRSNSGAGGLAKPAEPRLERQITMVQRRPGRMGRGLGVSTGWVLRLQLAKRKVAQVTGASYRKIDDAGLHITVGTEDRVLPADTIVLCTGQEPERTLHGELAALGVTAHLIGGAHEAAELDAMRAIDQGMRLALEL
jgi:2,4-dienoyl-CoA reductase (NADPH2)